MAMPLPRWLGKEEMVMDQAQVLGSHAWPASEAIDSARGMLEEVAATQRDAADGPVVPRMTIAAAAGLIERAVDRITRLRALHEGVGQVYGLYVEFFARTAGGSGSAGARRWAELEAQRAGNVARIDAALRGLRSATAHASAAAAAERVRWALPQDPGSSPSRLAWLSATEQHARRALDEATAAQEALEQLRAAVLREFPIVWWQLID